MVSLRSANRTDLPVLLPVAEQSLRAALIERREGTYRLNMQPRHAVWVFVIFGLSIGAEIGRASCRERV